jgi:hypothetical protein
MLPSLIGFPTRRATWCALALLIIGVGSAPAQGPKDKKSKPFVVAEQGSLNNVAVADLLSEYLRKKGLDKH